MKNSSGIRGLDIILGDVDFPPMNSTNGYRLLIQGAPGSGKTSMGLHLLHHQLISNIQRQKKDQSHGLVMYYQEDAIELDRIAYQYQLDFEKHPPDTVKVGVEEFSKNFPFLREKWLAERSENLKLCILVDGLSLIKRSQPDKIHEYLMQLLLEIPRKNLFLIIIAEENIVASDTFFEYMVDGVINLSIGKERQRHRFLEITKFRYVDFMRGKHGFELFHDPVTNKSCLQVFPRPATYFAKQYAGFSSTNKIGHLKCAIHGLEETINGLSALYPPIQDQEKPFKSGDVFVITAEPGNEKYAMGLTFLSPLIEEKSNERGIWVNFGHNSLADFLNSTPYKSRFDKLRQILFAKGQNGIDIQSFFEISRTNSSMHPDRITLQLMEQMKKSQGAPVRVVIDNISHIGSEFNEPERVSEYILWISRVMKQFNAVTLIFVDLSHAFQPISDINLEWEEVADYIGHLRWFEINNQLTPTFVLTKSKFSTFRSVPYYINAYTEGPKQGMMWLEDRGRSMISMLSGRMDTIKEAKVFLKFFDQNYSTNALHTNILDDFKRRYSSDQIFTHVFRMTPSPKHWSFRGYAGAGHSNTKVVCLKQYIIQVMEADNVLCQIPKDEWEKFSLQTNTELPEKEYVQARAYNLWGLTTREQSNSSIKNIGNAIPLYADIGVLCMQTDQELLEKKTESEYGKVLSKQWFPTKSPTTWNELIEINKKFLEYKEIDHCSDKTVTIPPWIDSLFALPSISTDSSSFMAFFLELLVDHYNESLNTLFARIKEDGLRPLIESKALIDTIYLLRKLVAEGVSKTPIQKIHYHSAYYSRRWFSKIDQYPISDPRLPINEKYKNPESEELRERLRFSISQLPSHSAKSNFGFSCLDFYSIGLIRGALAPETAWMFISELASSGTDTMRFEQRRGLPTLRENWSAPSENPVRLNDRHVIDLILDGDRYFCNFWIKNYWQIESKMHNLLRKIFISLSDVHILDTSKYDIKQIKPTAEDLQNEFIEILKNIDRDKTSHH